MNFLKKLGGIIAAVSGVFLGFAPAFTRAVPGSQSIMDTISKDLAQVGNIVVEVEAFGQLKGLNGADKAKVAGPLVAQILLSSTVFYGKKIYDPVAFQAAAVTIAGGIADALNAVHEDATKDAVTAIPK